MPRAEHADVSAAKAVHGPTRTVISVEALRGSVVRDDKVLVHPVHLCSVRWFTVVHV
jgi:hypothetical protein